MNLLPLDEFRRALHYNPWHFWGFATSATDNANNLVPVRSNCNAIVAQYAYQQMDIGGRAEIAEAIENAERRLFGFLNYEVAPRYKEVTVPYPLYFNEQFTRLYNMDALGRWIGIQSPDGYVQALGIEALTLLDTPAVTYSSQQGNALNDTFTVTAVTSETDPSKLAVYFAAADRLDNQGANDRWRIQPVQISISGGVATIRGRAWLLAKPILYEGYSMPIQPLDPLTAANFVTTLDVYVRTTNPNGQTVTTSQGEFIWETLPPPNWAVCCYGNGNNASDAAAQGYAIARVGIRDSYNGIVIPGQAIYNSTTGEWVNCSPFWDSFCRPPNQVRLRYLAGHPLEADGSMNTRLQKCVARFAMAIMAQKICGCDDSLREFYYWQQNLSRIGNNNEMFAISRKNITNPFGQRRGEIYAWNELYDLRLERGASA